MTLQHTRHRLATLRNDLAEQLRNLKSGSTIYKTTKGRMGGVMDAIEICDQELLAEEQGGPTPSPSLADPCAWQTVRGEPDVLRPDQLAWLTKRKGDV